MIPAQDTPTPPPRLLVVDDNPLYVHALYEMFCADHDVFMATDGTSALAACDTVQPDLVMLDVLMPGMNGFEVCQRLKANDKTRDIPVVFVTTLGQPGEETRGLEVGAVDYVRKPLNPSVVRARVRNHLELKRRADALRKLSRVDALTTVANRRAFDERLHHEWDRARRAMRPLGVLMIDIDHFKAYNDTYGHVAGDTALNTVGRTLQAALRRPADFVARYGGEEFVCILPEADAEDVVRAAEYLRGTIGRACIPHTASPTAAHITASVGCAIAHIDPDLEVEDLLNAADHSLYLAKHAGRDRVGPLNRVTSTRDLDILT